jgi:hypothetical protein
MNMEELLGFVGKRELVISRAALAAGLLEKPWASALRLIVFRQSLVKLWCIRTHQRIVAHAPFSTQHVLDESHYVTSELNKET